MGAPVQTDLCVPCNGTGWVRAHECAACLGTGRRTVNAGGVVERPIGDELRAEIERTIRRALHRVDAVHIAGAVALSVVFAAHPATPLRHLASYGVGAPVMAAVAAVIAAYARRWDAPLDRDQRRQLAAWGEGLSRAAEDRDAV